MNGRLRYAMPHLLMFGLSLVLYEVAAGIDTSAAVDRLGPDVWPKAVVVLMAALSLYETIRRLALGPPRADAAEAGGSASGGASAADASEPAPVDRRMLAGGAALIAGYVIALPWLGFFVTTALFLSGFAWVGGFRRPLINAVIGLGGSFLMVVLFMRVAYVSLPLGAGVFQDLSTTLMALLGVK